jgi:hypothetical protein
MSTQRFRGRSQNIHTAEPKRLRKAGHGVKPRCCPVQPVGWIRMPSKHGARRPLSRTTSERQRYGIQTLVEHESMASIKCHPELQAAAAAASAAAAAERAMVTAGMGVEERQRNALEAAQAHNRQVAEVSPPLPLSGAINPCRNSYSNRLSSMTPCESCKRMLQHTSCAIRSKPRTLQTAHRSL